MKTLSLCIALSLLAANVAATAAEPVATPAPVPAPAKQAPAKSQQPARPATSAASTPSASTTSSVELDTTQITGNRELPRVLYVVPWKRADLGELSGKPTKSLLDEVLAPVDRDVFQRQNRYHDALQPDAAVANKPTAADGTEAKP